MKRAKFYCVHVSFEGSSNVMSTWTSKKAAEASAARYAVWAKENATLLGYNAPSYTNIQVIESDQHMGPFTV